MNIMKAKKTKKEELADMTVGASLPILPEKENSYRASIYQLKQENPEYKSWKFKIANDESGQRGIWRVA